MSFLVGGYYIFIEKHLLGFLVHHSMETKVLNIIIIPNEEEPPGGDLCDPGDDLLMY